LTDWALRRGSELDGLTVERPSLEDVYLRLIGHQSVSTMDGSRQ
jgi:ABC-2 type transport system ATP-binding protein